MATFDIDCTLPPARTAFVRSPNARGTLDIVWPCLAVIVLCTWSVLHMNVPLQVVPRNRKQKFIRTINRTSTKLSWMLFNMLAPEMPFAQAAIGIASEQLLKRGFDKWKEIDGVSWSRAHTQLANMGGFVVAFGPDTERLAQHADVEQGNHLTCVVEEKYCKRTRKSMTVGPFEHTSAPVTITTSKNETVLELRTPRIGSLHSDSIETASLQLRPASSPPARLYPVGGNSNDVWTSWRQQQMTELPTTGSDVSIDWPLVGTSSQRLPPRAQILMGRHASMVCPHSMPMSYWSGDLDFQLDAVNIATARKSYRSFWLHRSPDKTEAQESRWLFNLKVLCFSEWVLDAKQLLRARELGIISKLPAISEDQIQDLNKGDAFVKFLAICQISWLCIQLIVRRKQEMPITQLEVLTLAFTVCSVLTYCMLSNRPKDVQTTRQIHATRYPRPEEMSRIAHMGPDVYLGFRYDTAIPNNAIYHTRGFYLPLSSITAIMIFGSLHFVAWDFEYPSPIEKTLWKSSTIATLTAIPALLLTDGIDWIWRKLPEEWLFGNDSMLKFILLVVHALCWSIFVAARLFILYESVNSLRYQPSKTFRSTWAANVPHAG